MLIRLFFILFSFFSLFFAETSQQESQEIKIPEKYEGYSHHIQWFASAGVGGLYQANSLFLDNYLGLGFIIPYSSRVSHYFSIDFDSIFMNDWYKKYAEYVGVNSNDDPSSGGYAISLSVNYNFGYSVFYARDYEVEFLGGVGVGGQFEILDVVGGNKIKKNSFLLNANFGIRNIFFENHALDFLLRTNLFNLGRDFIFSFNYTFLRI